jgi:hypothetical protein
VVKKVAVDVEGVLGRMEGVVGVAGSDLCSEAPALASAPAVLVEAGFEMFADASDQGSVGHQEVAAVDVHL